MKLERIFVLMAALVLMSAVAWGQDQYRSLTSGNWNLVGTWEISSDGGTTWLPATLSTPGATNSVYIQSGHTVTLTGNEACNDLHISTGTTSATVGSEAFVALASNTLQVNGKLRCYFAAVGTVPGTSTTTVHTAPITITASSTGKLSFVGNSRNITNTGEWAAPATGNTTTFAVEVAMNFGQTATMGTSIKASSWSISSGTLDASTFRISIDNGTTGQGDVTIASGTTLKSAATGTGTSAVFGRTGTTASGTLTVNGTLILNGAAPAIAMNSIAFNSTLEYSRSGAQTFVDSLNLGALPYTYTNLKLSGSGVKSTVANRTTSISANGSLEMSGGATPPTFAVGASGTFSVSSTSTTIIYTATGAQTTGTEWDANFQNVTINNGSGITLGASKTVNGTLTLTSGNLTLGSNNLTLSGSVSGAGTGQCVVTNSTGGAVRSIAASGSFTFPIAPSATTYNPVTIALAGGDPTESFTVSAASGLNPPTADDTRAVQRTWTISEGTPGGNNATLTFQWASGETGVNFFYGSLSAWRYDGANWLEVSAGTLGGANPYTLQTNSTLSSFSPWTVGNTGALPVQLASFTAMANRLDAELHWSTATETNNYGFEIERTAVSNQLSANGWQKVGFVAGSGTSTTPHEYSYADRNLASSRYAYRLKQVDNDGTFSYSGSAEVEIGLAAKEFKLESNYPNPFNPSTTIQFTLAEDGKASLKVFNMLGQEVATLFEGEAQAGRVQQVKFDASRLPSGLYFAKLEAGKQQTIRKMMLVK